MSSFLNNAERIFEVARQSSEPEDLTIRLNPEGGIHVISGPDYSYSSDTTYRVRRGQGVVEVQGSAGGHMCLLRTAKVQAGWMLDRPMYMVA